MNEETSDSSENDVKSDDVLPTQSFQKGQRMP